MKNLFDSKGKGPGSEFNSEAEIISLLDDVAHPYAVKIRMEVGTVIYSTKNGKLTFAPLSIAENGTPLEVNVESSLSSLNIAPSRVFADWHSHTTAPQSMSGADRDLAISLNRK